MHDSFIVELCLNSFRDLRDALAREDMAVGIRPGMVGRVKLAARSPTMDFCGVGADWLAELYVAPVRQAVGPDITFCWHGARPCKCLCDVISSLMKWLGKARPVRIGRPYCTFPSPLPW